MAPMKYATVLPSVFNGWEHGESGLAGLPAKPALFVMRPLSYFLPLPALFCLGFLTFFF
jgi:hypothetical protein